MASGRARRVFFLRTSRERQKPVSGNRADYAAEHFCLEAVAL
jgi:hypothetical protein